MNIVYAIVDEPFCLWERDLKTAALGFLESIDYDYFNYIADRSNTDLDNPEWGMRAATSMRLALFHGGETLFLLIGALLQGERCPHAWVAHCKTDELRTIINQINSSQPLLLQNDRIKKLSWLDISREILSKCPSDAIGLCSTIESFAKFWELLALNHTHQIYIDEYNSLKHGFRIAPGGFEAMMGLHPLISVPPSGQEMQSLGSSKWGANFRVIKRLDDDPRASRSRQSIYTAVNWNAEAVSFSLRLVADSIRNVTNYLRMSSGLEEAQFHLPTPLTFELASKRVDLLSMSMPTVSHEACAVTKEQLMNLIKKNSLKKLVLRLKFLKEKKLSVLSH